MQAMNHFWEKQDDEGSCFHWNWIWMDEFQEIYLIQSALWMCKNTSQWFLQQKSKTMLACSGFVLVKLFLHCPERKGKGKKYSLAIQHPPPPDWKFTMAHLVCSVQKTAMNMISMKQCCKLKLKVAVTEATFSSLLKQKCNKLKRSPINTRGTRVTLPLGKRKKKELRIFAAD